MKFLKKSLLIKLMSHSGFELLTQRYCTLFSGLDRNDFISFCFVGYTCRIYIDYFLNLHLFRNITIKLRFDSLPFKTLCISFSGRKMSKNLPNSTLGTSESWFGNQNMSGLCPWMFWLTHMMSLIIGLNPWVQLKFLRISTNAWILLEILWKFVN